MKNKLLLFTLLSILFNLSDAGAQDKRTSEYGVEKRTNSIFASFDYGKPNGDFGKTYNNGYGATFGYRFALTEFNSLVTSIGYMKFDGAIVLPNNPIYDLSANFLPVKFGLRFRFLKNFYVSGETGATIALRVKGIDQLKYSPLLDENNLKGVFLNFAPTFGVQIPVKGKDYIDLGVRYEGMISRGSHFFTGIRAAYAFDVAR